MWGPLGQPAIQTIDIWTYSQRRYLEALEAIMVPSNVPQAPLSATQNLMRDLFTGASGSVSTADPADPARLVTHAENRKKNLVPVLMGKGKGGVGHQGTILLTHIYSFVKFWYVSRWFRDLSYECHDSFGDHGSPCESPGEGCQEAFAGVGSGL